MPPRTRRRGTRQDENTPTTATTTTTGGASATLASRKKRSGLGLVLDNIVPQTSTPFRSHRPPRRAPKPVKQTTATLSSLPPSSPPVPSPIVHASTHPAYEGFIEPVEPVTPAGRDDPFGFFAAERRLRERRQRLVDNPTRPPQQRNTELEVQEDENINDGRPAFATPPELQRLADSEPSFELDLSTLSGIHTPPGHTPDPRAVSPRHRRPKRKEIPPSPASSRSESPTRGPHGEQISLPHTPSPMDRLRSSVPRQSFADIVAQINSPAKPAATTTVKKGKKGGKAKSGPLRKKYKTDETLAEEELKGIAEELQELLPRRPTSKAAQRKSVQPQNTNTQKTVAPTKKPKSTSQKGKKTQAAKPRSKKAAMKHKEEDIEESKEKEGESFVLSGEEREQFEIDREKRRDYFRQVDDYIMSEESVYII